LSELYKKNPVQAADSFDNAFELRPTLLHARIGKALGFAIRKQEPKGLEIVQEIENTISARGAGDPEAIYKLAQAYTVLGDKRSALRVMRNSIEGGFFSYPYIVADPLLHPLKNETEFGQLVAMARQRHEAFKHSFF
jgi:hypothetical protein